MIEKQDYYFAQKADIAGGIAYSQAVRASVFFTKNYIFEIPSMKSSFRKIAISKGALEWAIEMNSRAADMTVEEFEKAMLEALEEENVIPVADCEKFNIQGGWWIFGQIRLKVKGRSPRAISVQPKAFRLELRKFYNLN